MDLMWSVQFTCRALGIQAMHTHVNAVLARYVRLHGAWADWCQRLQAAPMPCHAMPASAHRTALTPRRVCGCLCRCLCSLALAGCLQLSASALSSRRLAPAGGKGEGEGAASSTACPALPSGRRRPQPPLHDPQRTANCMLLVQGVQVWRGYGALPAKGSAQAHITIMAHPNRMRNTCACRWGLHAVLWIANTQFSTLQYIAVHCSAIQCTPLMDGTTGKGEGAAGIRPQAWEAERAMHCVAMTSALSVRRTTGQVAAVQTVSCTGVVLMTTARRRHLGLHHPSQAGQPSASARGPPTGRPSPLLI